MSRSITITDTITKNIGSYDSTDYAWASQSNIANCYAGSSSTSYGQINLTTGNGATTYVYFIFDSLSAIPSDATITSVSCSCKCSINTTTSYRVSTRQAQLYSGTSSKGTAYNVANSTTAFSITAGSWTRAELQSARLRIYAVRGTSNTTTNYYFRFYGATITVNYSYQGTAYTITASSSASGVTVTPASQEKMQGESASVTLNTNENIVVTDNNVDVTSQLVRTQASGTIEKIPNAVVESTFTNDTSYPTSNGLSDTTSSSYARFKLASTTQHAIYSFDTSAIPTTATILSVACSVRAYVTSTSSNISTKTARLYAGTTAKGSAYTLPTSNTVWSFSSVGSWTASEIRNIRIRFDGAYSGSNSYYIRFYGAELTVTYQDSGYVYVYTMTNLSADHTILVVATGGGLSYDIRVKNNGSWVKVQKVYVKQNGTWREATNVLVKDNGTWK